MLPIDTVDAVLDRASLVFTEEQVENALKDMAATISEHYATLNPIFLCVMTGALFPTARLLAHCRFPLQLDYIHATRYHGTQGREEIKWLAYPRYDLKDRHIILIDDVLDAGVTLAALLAYVKEQGAASVKTAVLLDKKTHRSDGGVDHADFIGLEVDDRYVFGSGMDYHEYFRNLSGIYAAHPEDC